MAPVTQAGCQILLDGALRNTEGATHLHGRELAGVHHAVHRHLRDAKHRRHLSNREERRRTRGGGNVPNHGSVVPSLELSWGDAGVLAVTPGANTLSITRASTDAQEHLRPIGHTVISRSVGVASLRFPTTSHASGGSLAFLQLVLGVMDGPAARRPAGPGLASAGLASQAKRPGSRERGLAPPLPFASVPQWSPCHPDSQERAGDCVLGVVPCAAARWRAGVSSSKNRMPWKAHCNGWATAPARVNPGLPTPASVTPPGGVPSCVGPTPPRSSSVLLAAPLPAWP